MSSPIKASLATAALIFSVAAVATPAATLADSTTNPCGLTNASTGANFKISGQTVTANFAIPASCAKGSEISLVSYKAPSANGQPFIQQTIFQSKSATFMPGFHSMTLGLPNCFFQTDLFVGPPIQLNSFTSDRAAQAAAAFVTLAGVIGGSTVCAPTPVTVPTPTPTPVTTAAAPVAATPLPATGPEAALAGLVGSGAIGYATMAYRRSRQNLADKLRRK